MFDSACASVVRSLTE